MARWSSEYSCSVVTLVALLVMAASAPVAAQERQNKPNAPVTVAELKFDQGRKVRVQGRLVGTATHEYTFIARKGQRVGDRKSVV